MNTLVLGEPGSGKTMSTARKVQTKRAVVVIDPQYSLARNTAALSKKGIGIRLKEGSSFRFVRLRLFPTEAENRDERQRVARIFLGRRALDPTTSPLIYEWLEAALIAVQYGQAPLWTLPYCFKPETEWFQYLAQFNPKIASLEFFSRTQLRNETSPTARATEPVCDDPRFQALCGNDDLTAELHNGKTIIFSGYGGGREAIRTLCLLMMTEVLTACEREEIKVTVIIDEVQNYGLLTPDVLFWLNTLRKQGVEIIIITQSLGFDAETRHVLLQACQRREYFRCGAEMALEAAKDLATGSYNPNSNWYTEAEFTNRERQHYFSYSQQETLIAQKLMQLPVGTRYVNEFGSIIQEKVTLPKIFNMPSLIEQRAERFFSCPDSQIWQNFWTSTQ